MIEQPITAPAPLTELVTDTDHVHLSRLVTESACESTSVEPTPCTDAGPLVALIDADEADHGICVQSL